MVWNKGLPLGTTPIKNSDQMIRDNWDGIETGLVPFAKLRLDEQGSDPSNISDTVLIYSKQVDGITRLFCREESGTVIPITEGGALPLSEIASDPTNAANKGFIYTKVSSGNTELFWEDENGNVLQITSGGTFNIASKAEMETGTSDVKLVTPARQQYHKSAAKAWLQLDGITAISINSSYNISSVTHVATGDYDIFFITNFSSANFSSVATARGTDNTTAGNQINATVHGKTTSSVSVRTGIIGNLAASTTVFADSDDINVVMFGGQ